MIKILCIIGMLLLACLALTACAPATLSKQAQAGATLTTEATLTAGATVTAKNDPKYGWILADQQGMTLYTYQQDMPDQSNCTGSCASGWPPLTVAMGTLPSAGPHVTGKVDVIQRSDGSWQITYDQLPVYRYSGDESPQDVRGEAMDGSWNVIAIR